MALNKVEICGVNTARLPILTNEEKDALFIQIRQGDAAAREQINKGNLRLVLSVIRRFPSAGENVDDLFQIGCIGLIKAIDHFNTALGVRFSPYAVPMIIGEIRAGIAFKKEPEGAVHHRGCLRGRHLPGGYCLCPRRHPESHEPV